MKEIEKVRNTQFYWPFRELEVEINKVRELAMTLADENSQLRDDIQQLTKKKMKKKGK